MERRTFLKTSSLAAGSWITATPLKGNAERLKVGIVGTGWWGTDYLLNFGQQSGQFDIVALCDVSKVRLDIAVEKLGELGGGKPTTYTSYEELYEHPGLQAVIIATPTHWHALQFIAACKKGLHIWQEKPLSYDIRESQAMKRAYKAANVVVNIDFPRLHGLINDQVKDAIQSGQIGEVYQIQANIHNSVGYAKEVDIPDTVDFDAYCGPGPMLKYLDVSAPGRMNWRIQQACSRGIFADWGIHYLQNIRSIMNLQLPDHVSAIGGITRQLGQDHPDHLEVRMDYDGLPVHWSHKGYGYTSPLPHTNIGAWYYGDKGTLFAADSGWEIYPGDGSERKEYGNARVKLGSNEYEQEIRREFIAQFTKFADAIRASSEKEIKGTFEDGFNATATTIYADLAFQTKQQVTIDKSSMNVIGNEDAEKMLLRPYRPPYKHPYSS